VSRRDRRADREDADRAAAESAARADRAEERWESQAAVEAFRGCGPSDDQSADMLAASVAEYDVAGVRQLT
jgi:hypothetical protein